MGMCYSLRSGGDPLPISAHVEGEVLGVRGEWRTHLRLQEKAERKRSKIIDKTLKVEKREYKQTHRLLLLGLSYNRHDKQ